MRLIAINPIEPPVVSGDVYNPLHFKWTGGPFALNIRPPGGNPRIGCDLTFLADGPWGGSIGALEVVDVPDVSTTGLREVDDVVEFVGVPAFSMEEVFGAGTDFRGMVVQTRECQLFTHLTERIVSFHTGRGEVHFRVVSGPVSFCFDAMSNLISVEVARASIPADSVLSTENEQFLSMEDGQARDTRLLRGTLPPR